VLQQVLCLCRSRKVWCTEAPRSSGCAHDIACSHHQTFL
jgi:hypothetical protein